MKRSNLVFLVAAALLLCCIAAPAGAVLLEVTVKGPVASVMPAKDSITISDPQKYGCSYPAIGAPVCSWAPMTDERSVTTSLSGTVPDKEALSVFKTGDLVVATSIGGAGETWISLAKLYGSRANEEYVTNIVGDIGSIPTPLIGDYAIDATTIPDCASCTGTTCVAGSSKVIIKSEGKAVAEKTLKPGESFMFNARNDGSSVTVKFVKGEALSATCPQVQAGMVGGKQPVSDYFVTIVPPISSLQTNIRTATTTRPEEARPTAAVTTGTTVAAVPSETTVPQTTQKSGMFPVAVIGALGVAGLLFVMRKE